jgi:hypothetical protein
VDRIGVVHRVGRPFNAETPGARREARRKPKQSRILVHEETQ